MGLSVGRRGVPSTKPELLHGTRLMAHGLDCRLNSFMLMELASFLSRHKKRPEIPRHAPFLLPGRNRAGRSHGVLWQEPSQTGYCY